MHYKIIQELESNNSRLFKEDVIKREMELENGEFFDGLNLALNKLRTFGVKAVDESTTGGPGLDNEQFMMVVHQLENRKLTGHAARDAIAGLMKLATKDQWNFWYRRILIKDLRCGITEKTVNNVAKKLGQSFVFGIPVFECMLAHDSANHEKKMVGKKLLDYKLDGVRVLAVYNADTKEATMYSRNGKQFLNFGHIEQEICNTIGKQFKESMVLDGEMVSSSFQALMKQVHRKDNVEATDAKYALFDVLTLEEFQNGGSKLGTLDRHKKLQDIMQHADKDSNMFVVDKVECDLDTDTGQKIFTDYNKMAIDKGFEGIMIKDVDAPYECKRSHYMLKAKPFIEVTLKVKDVEEGTGRNEGKLGALVCEGIDDGRNIKVNVGSGFSDSHRDSFWNNRSRIPGNMVEVRADAITKNQDSEDYSLRFPRFKTFRGFEIGEKI